MALVMIAPTYAFAASYSTTFEFSAAIHGPFRSYSAGTINVKTTSSTYFQGELYNKASSDTFTVTLVKDGFWSNTTIGSYSAKRGGTTTNYWTNLASGNYAMYLDKATDNWVCTGTMEMTQ